MKNFKRYKSFKDLNRKSYEVYLSACQYEISYLENVCVFYLEAIRHYEQLLILSNVSFVPLPLLEDFHCVRQSKVSK